MSQSPTKKTSDPLTSPMTTGAAPPDSKASSVSSKATALMSTPEPKAMTMPMTRLEACA